MSVLKSIIKRWNKNTEIYDTLHLETEHAQVVDFGEGTVMHLLATTLANTVEAVSTDSLFGKLVSKLLDATGVQYNFSNSSAWYICFGSLLGGLIVQGGTATFGGVKENTVNFSLSFNSSPMYLGGFDAGSAGGAAFSIAVIVESNRNSARYIANSTEAGYFLWIALGV